VVVRLIGFLPGPPDEVGADESVTLAPAEHRNDVVLWLRPKRR
jgi:hypothetical protein